MDSLFYFSFCDLNNSSSGISKKVNSQIKAFIKLGLNVYYSEYSKVSSEVRISLDNKVIVRKKINNYIPSFLKKIYLLFSLFYNVIKIIKSNRIFNIYVRKGTFYSPLLVFLIGLLLKSRRIIVEIPTYPYISELDKYPIQKRTYLKILDWVARKFCYKKVYKIATFSDDDEIFGVSTIKISNGSDFEFIKKHHNKRKNEVLNFTFVGSLEFWHGVDRFISSLKIYGINDVHFNIVGNGPMFTKILDIVNNDSYLSSVVTMHGNKFGSELLDIYTKTDIGVGSLGRHRTNLSSLQSLKNREYLMAGLPILYSTRDNSLPVNLPFSYFCDSDESLIDIFKVKQWYDSLQVTNEAISNYAKERFTWIHIMKKVVSYYN